MTNDPHLDALAAAARREAVKRAAVKLVRENLAAVAGLVLGVGYLVAGGVVLTVALWRLWPPLALVSVLPMVLVAGHRRAR